MAYAALVSLKQTIDQILNHDRYSISPHEKGLIISLDRYVISLQFFLEDFPERANRLEGRIRDVAAAAEDIIECFMLDQKRSSCGYMWMWRGVELPVIKFGHELSKVARKMESVVAKVVEIKNSIVIEDDEQLIDSSIASSSSSGDGNFDMVGFDDDLMDLKGHLLGESRKLQFLSIVGMGGIGKTTLAKTAFDDQSIQEHFQIRAWLTISQNYRYREIIASLLDSMKEFNPKGCVDRNESMSVREMSERVYKILKGRRYMIVMDDMWSTTVLDDLRMVFPDDGNGSRIMLTTRLSDVAAYADSSIPPHEMRLMDEGASWNLLRQKVRASPELETVGKEIARSCRGLPLAVVVVAGVLSTITRTPASWGRIARNINSVASKDGRLEKILSLSYNHLPHRLRPCLLYMGVFPEDYTIRVSELIKLWIAEGFLKLDPSGGYKSLEEAAEEYLEDLVRRNLILVSKRKCNGRIKSCSLHDMVRDTCLRFLQEEQSLRQVREEENTKQGRASVSKRSILRFNVDYQGPFEHSRLLRVLHVPKSMYTFEYPPWEILKLLHLRHLAICCDSIPSAISNLENLQTLVISKLLYVELPSSLWSLRQLRHLICRAHLPNPEGATSALENLQTLKEVHDQEHRAFLLARTPSLRKLGLYYNPGDFSGGRHLNESLVRLRQLEKLKIRIKFVRYSLDVVFPLSLKKCTLHSCRFSLRYFKAIGSLPNLEVLKLITCSLGFTSWVICSGEFPQLKVLFINNLDFATLLTEDSSAFPRLKRLHLRGCFHLEEISDDIGEIPTLELIEVYRCGLAVYDWAKRTQEEQLSFGNDILQVRCIRPRNQ